MRRGTSAARARSVPAVPLGSASALRKHLAFSCNYEVYTVPFMQCLNLGTAANRMPLGHTKEPWIFLSIAALAKATPDLPCCSIFFKWFSFLFVTTTTGREAAEGRGQARYGFSLLAGGT